MSKVSRAVTAIVAVAAIAIFALATAACAVFPNDYSKETEEAAKEFGLPGALVRAVVWAESGYDSDAVSHKGAAGLMQLMPETFGACAARIGVENADPFDPVTSLRCGCFYLSELISRFDGDVDAALMAYNAGESNARDFISGKEVFAETRTYLRRVHTARKFYGLFYG